MASFLLPEVQKRGDIGHRIYRRLGKEGRKFLGNESNGIGYGANS
jgi:hypothetical protein